ncbi:hypothetical protein LZ554_008479 [Drepanopeziza brunnea f. sp. 'monogermtubi']|nr:hypothetical protein LZ554_008479 [Drepanopeziza brunnea f. sp. 'monogermtubi']
MEVQTLELTAEEILEWRRGWVQNPYVDNSKTDVEKLELLYQRHLTVTFLEVRKSIGERGLVRPASLGPPPQATPSKDGWQVVSAPRASPTPSSMSYTPSDPHIASLYANRPLPSLPAPKPKPKPKADTKSKVLTAQSSDRNRICHHDSKLSEVHDVETILSSVPIGPTQREVFVEDYQGHAQVAVGLEAEQSSSISCDEGVDLGVGVLPAWKRAGDWREGARRHRVGVRVAKRVGPWRNSRRERVGECDRVLNKMEGK